MKVAPSPTRTLNTEDTIIACHSFYKIPSKAPSPNDLPNLGELQVFCCIENGLDGHDGICHGGFMSAVMDHVMGSLARAYPGGITTYTKYLHVNFQKPFFTPGAFLCRAWMTRVENHKLWLYGRMEGRQGNPYITAEGLFLKGGPKL